MSLPTLRIKNKGMSTTMRMVHIVEIDQYLLLPSGVYLGYDRKGREEARLNIRWGVRGSDYTYSHETVSGLMKMYLTQITSPISIRKSGLFEPGGLIKVTRRSKPIDPSKVFCVYDTELEAILAMRRLLSISNIPVDVTQLLESTWVDLKEEQPCSI